MTGLSDKELKRQTARFDVREKRKMKRDIAKAKKNPSITRTKGESRKPESVTNRVLVGDVVCRKNAYTYKHRGHTMPTENFKKYTVGETDDSNRWFRVEGDTKWHNANDFMLLEKAKTELQKLVEKVMATEKVESADDTDGTDSPETT